MSKLYKSHRTFGYEVARTAADGYELVVLQTAPNQKLEVSLASLLMPVSPDEALFEARMALAAAIERARFLGVDAEQLSTLFQDELMRAD